MWVIESINIRVAVWVWGVHVGESGLELSPINGATGIPLFCMHNKGCLVYKFPPVGRSRVDRGGTYSITLSRRVFKIGLIIDDMSSVFRTFLLINSES